MPELYCVRAEFGKYTDHFIKGGYVAIGWLPKNDLVKIKSRDEIYPLYKKEYPKDVSNVVIGQQVGQIARFLLEIKSGDYVITPSSNTEYIYYGIVQNEPSYYFDNGADGCPYLHRRKIKWNKTPIQRNAFSVPFQNTIRSSLTVYYISHKNNFFEAIGKKELISESDKKIEYDNYSVVLNRLLELDAREFELLITNLLTALGFEDTEHRGKVGDGGVDAVGVLNVSNLAKIKVYVQAKRHRIDVNLSANTVKTLRQSIPRDGQGAFIVTCDFQKAAHDVAVEQGFPRIGLINGKQLVDILVEHWEDIEEGFQEKLNLKPGLVLK